MTKSISEFKGVSNNLNFIKFVAALLVMYNHSFALTLGKAEPMFYLFSDGITLGGIAVAVFLFTSGYFVSKSYASKSNRDFVISRFARIYPLYMSVILLCAFVLGPLATTLSLKEYFTNGGTYKYLLSLFFLPVNDLPGVFENHAFTAVNGALWALRLDIACYIALFIAGNLKLLNKKAITVISVPVAILFITVFALKFEPLYKYHDYLKPLYMFYAGVLCFTFSDKIRLSAAALAASLLLLFAGFYFGYADFALMLVLPYLLCFAIFSKRQLPSIFGKLGKISYAMYLIGFIIQQVFVMCFKTFPPYKNLLFSAVADIIIAAVLYFVIEKPLYGLIITKCRKQSPKSMEVQNEQRDDKKYIGV